ncbi:MAG: DUF4443 domain-containing protein [Candidatus Heimdallarchaeota archaeon]
MLELLEQLCGPRPLVPRKFTGSHAIMALFYLKEEPYLGRYILQERLGLSEASVRSILKLLRRYGLIQVLSQRKGHRLSSKGEEFVQWLMDRIVPLRGIQLRNLIPKEYISAGFVVKGARQLVTSGIEQRDDVIRTGALGAIILIVDSIGIRFPSEEPNMIDYATGDLDELQKTVSEHTKQGDVIVIGWGRNSFEAENGAITAAIKLLNTIAKKSISDKP